MGAARVDAASQLGLDALPLVVAHNYYRLVVPGIALLGTVLSEPAWF